MTHNNTLIETLEHKGFKVEIHHDDDPISPRDDENLTTLACWHRRYNLGDKKIEYMTEEEVRESVPDILVIIPLYLYDHSGITMNTTGFTCGFDSGQVGWGYITKEDAEKMGCVGPEWTEERLKESLRSDVETYDYYISGNMYGYKVFNHDNDEVESCWGFFGDMENARVGACKIIDSWKGKMK